MVRPVIVAAVPRSGVPAPFCLAAGVSATWRAVSSSECMEFCLAREDAGRPPLAGAGELRAGFISGNVLRIGEEAIEGAMAEVTVLFLRAC